MANTVCEECKYCWNYKVSELGCYGSYKPCEHYVGEDREKVLETIIERDKEWTN